MKQFGKIALLGAGTMATPVGLNLLKSGYEVTVWNRTSEKCEPLVKAGALQAETPKEAVEGADIALSILKDDLVSREVWSGSYGAREAIGKDATVIELSTISPEWSKQLAAMAVESGARYLEAPMAGGPKAAEDANLILLLGGNRSDIDRIDDVLATISRERIHVGDVGSATTLKIIRNLFLASQVTGLAEILALASKANLNMGVVVASILKGPTASPLIGAVIEDMVANREGNDFTIDLLRKDVEYGLSEAKRAGLALDVVEAAKLSLAKAQDAGLGQRSVTMLAKAIADTAQAKAND